MKMGIVPIFIGACPHFYALTNILLFRCEEDNIIVHSLEQQTLGKDIFLKKYLIENSRSSGKRVERLPSKEIKRGG